MKLLADQDVYVTTIQFLQGLGQHANQFAAAGWKT